MRRARYFWVGVGFGLVALKSEIVSWYRIQEMFRFQSFHMYSVIGSAVIVAAVSVWLIKQLKLTSLSGEAIHIAPKATTYPRYLTGGVLFGLGWALVGACPGPIFVLIGSGTWTYIIVLLGALIGTWAYGVLRRYLPH
ncbi:MAG: DUF6691 family protein [Deinococcota bacterium]